jgi:hypothetical protein
MQGKVIMGIDGGEAGAGYRMLGDHELRTGE